MFDGIGNITASVPTNVYQPGAKRESAPAANPQRSFDSVMISANIKPDDARQKEMVSRIAKKVRTVSSSSELEGIRRQVEEGTYQPDPQVIADRILLMPEVD